MSEAQQRVQKRKSWAVTPQDSRIGESQSRNSDSGPLNVAVRPSSVNRSPRELTFINTSPQCWEHMARIAGGLQEAVAQLKFSSQGRTSDLDVSVGPVPIRDGEHSIDEIISAADGLLLRRKGHARELRAHNGRRLQS